MIVDHDVTLDGYAEGDVILRGAFVMGDVSFAKGSAFAVRGMAMGCEVVVGGDVIVRGGMIVAVGYDVAQELDNLIGADCRAKFGCLPDSVVIDGQNYTPVPPPVPAASTWPLALPALGRLDRALCLSWRWPMSDDRHVDVAFAVPSICKAELASAALMPRPVARCGR